jgi:hypothetical protein
MGRFDSRDNSPERSTPDRRDSQREPDRRPDARGEQTPRRAAEPNRSPCGEQRVRGTPRGTRARSATETRAQYTPRGRPESRGTGQDRFAQRSTALSREIPLSREQIRVVKEVGTFRVCRPDQLRIDQRQLDELRRTGLTREVSYKGQDYVTLTRESCQFARAANITDGMKVYDGPRKLRDAHHDSAIHAAYVKATEEVEALRGHVTSIARDEDLRHDVNRDRHNHPDDTPETIAERHGIGVDSDGKLQFPDLQIRYEIPGPELEIPGDELEASHVTLTENIEIVTDSYKASDIAAKASAGFSMVSANLDGGASRAGGVPVQSLADDIINF